MPLDGQTSTFTIYAPVNIRYLPMPAISKLSATVGRENNTKCILRCVVPRNSVYVSILINEE